MEQLLNYILENWETGLGIAAILLEIGLRIIPTEKNRSIFDLVVKTISFIIKNRRKPSPLDEIEGTKNKVWVDVKKHIIPIVFLFASIGCVGQVNSTFKSARSYNADSTTVRNEVNALQNFYGDIGALYYNEQSSKWRLFQDSVWYDLLGGGGGGGTYTAGSGLTLTGTEFKLGGVLTEDTTLPGEFSLTVPQLTSLYLGGAGLGTLQFGGGLQINSDVNISGNEFEVNTVSTTTFNSGGNFAVNSGGQLSLIGNGTVYMYDNNNGELSLGNDLTATVQDNIVLNGGNSISLEGGDINLVTSGVLEIQNIPNITETNVLYYNNTTGAVSWDVAPGGGGITNTAANTELAKSDGTNLIPSGVFVPSNGNIDLGSASIAGSPRTIQVVGSDASINLNLNAKSSGVTGVGSINFGANVFNLGNGSTTTGSSRTIQAQGTGTDININIVPKGTGGFNYVSDNEFDIGTTSSTTITLYPTNNTFSKTRHITSDTYTISSGTGTVTNNEGENIIIQAGSGYSVGNNVGGNISLTPGTGTGTATNGFIILNNLPSSCTGVPTNGLANVGGVLTICP